jgi:hypothetical protein
MDLEKVRKNTVGLRKIPLDLEKIEESKGGGFFDR